MGMDMQMGNKVYVEFYLENNSLINNYMYSLDTFLKDLFIDSVNLVHVSQDSDSEGLKSVIYGFDKPIMKFNEEAIVFFEKLDKTFQQYKDFLPHFTQFDEVDLTTIDILDSKDLSVIGEVGEE